MKKSHILLLLTLIVFSFFGSGCYNQPFVSSPPAITITNGTMQVAHIHLFGERIATLDPGESYSIGRYHFFSIFANTNRSKRVTFVAIQPQNNVLKISEKTFSFYTRPYESYQWTIQEREFR